MNNYRYYYLRANTSFYNSEYFIPKMGNTMKKADKK
jgi:hypothetical protein